MTNQKMQRWLRMEMIKLEIWAALAFSTLQTLTVKHLY